MRRARAADVLAAALLLVTVAALYLLLWAATGWRPPDAPAFGSTVLATTVVAVLARPLHRRLRGAVRRRAGVPLVSVPRSVRQTIEAGRTVGSPDDVGAQVLTVLGTALQPQRADLWAGAGSRTRRIAGWPSDAAPAAPKDPPGPSGAVIDRLLEHAGVPVGRLRVVLRYDEPGHRALLDAWCDQAGQVLAVVAHRENLRRREAALVRRRRLLRLSRSRLAAAEREARRRLERDLHDGAQQQLLAVGLALQVARRSAGRSPDRAREALGRAAELARRSDGELARVSAALYPARLRTGHLAAVIEQATRGGDLAVAVDQGPGGVGDDLTVELRTALYFVAMEAVQNAVKHGRASHAAIRLWSDDRHVHLEIADDGVGLGATAARPAARPGTGLRRLGERLAEVGGRLTVTPGETGGTVVSALAPRAGAGPADRTHGRARVRRAGEAVSA